MVTDSYQGRIRIRLRPVAASIALGAFLWASMPAQAVPSSRPDTPRPVSVQQQSSRPNIVVILLDDVGFAASERFGGAVRTPALDSLAASGITYNRFHTTSVCSPTRAALLTGRNAHRVGAGTVVEYPHPGYDWSWPKSTATVARVLLDNGYNTAAFGKWHNTPIAEISPVGPFDRWPTGLGFQHFYGFMQGEDSQWEPLLYNDTTAVDPPRPAKGEYHFAADITDRAINWLQTQASLASNRPYFLYYAAGGAHAPHHVAKEWIDKYRGRFDGGWDKYREEVFARQKKMGVIPHDTTLTPRPAELPAWNTLSADQKRLYVHQMEVFAGFLEYTDHEIGRLIEQVRQGPNGNNTLIFYIVGDNGASGEGAIDGSDVGLANIIYGLPSPVDEQLSHVDQLGSKLYDNHYSAGWAWATATPFRWMKRVASFFGGTRNPMVVSWPDGIKTDARPRSQFTDVNDIAPTIYDAAGIRAPDSVDGVAQQPLDGVSFAYSFDNPSAPSQHRVQYFEETGNRAIYQDGWIATVRRSVPWQLSCKPDFSTDSWELYDIEKDFSQAHDVAAQNPEKLKALQALFEREARANHVYPMQDGCIVKTAGSQPIDGKSAPAAPPSHFVYHAGMARLPVAKAPNFLKSHRITADVDIPPAGAEGVLLTNGGRYGGFTLYAKDGRLFYASNFFGKSAAIMEAPLPTGSLEIAYDYDREDPKLFGGGTGRLLVNGKAVALHRFDRIGAPAQFGSMGIGRSHGGPVVDAYDGAFSFTGTIKRITVDVK
ncbi:arylsulfatase [Sphingobium sp. EM0848]|uniref:arylsulfatase n=1 Tax=Sphingobium sp. EM0848 TaxID=2743473 RepID=UPI00159C6A0C|nr:arylsulfatase [Sphingobium sp. EM0848]